MHEEYDSIRNKISVIEYFNTHLRVANPRLYKVSEDRLKSLCPFHDETDASFHIYPQSNTYHCFGCGTGGDVITMHRKTLARYYNRYLTDAEAAKDLARLYNIPFTLPSVLQSSTTEIAGTEETVKLTPFQKARAFYEKPLIAESKGRMSLVQYQQQNKAISRLIALPVKVRAYADLDLRIACQMYNDKEEKFKSVPIEIKSVSKPQENTTLTADNSMLSRVNTIATTRQIQGLKTLGEDYD